MVDQACPADSVAAIVLAAGRSSRMGAFKPLLPFGGRTLIGHMVAVLRDAGVERIHVVTGFGAEALGAELDGLGTSTAHNADFDKGMLSSVQTGVAALPAAIERFLLLPVDMPLVRPSTIVRLLRAAASDDAAIFYPFFDGQRGHPPLIHRSLFAEILSYDGDGGLPALLARRERNACDVSAFDWGCLSDMDRPEDFRRLSAALVRHRFPDAAECDAMLEAAATPEPVRRHCRAVAALAADVALRLERVGEPINPDLTRAAAWVHDIAKGHPRHAEAGAALVSAFGFPELAEAIAGHGDLGAGTGRLDESAVVYLADKLIQGEMRVPLESRFARAFARFAEDAPALASVRRRFHEARAIREAIEARIGRLDPPRETEQEMLLGAA
jgi:CTP:molybdopterin cytidylyltransferase MocA